MTSMLTAAISGVISVLGSLCDFIFSCNYPGLVVSIGAVLVGIFLIDLGFDYLEYFMGGSGIVKEDSSCVRRLPKS